MHFRNEIMINHICTCSKTTLVSVPSPIETVVVWPAGTEEEIEVIQVGSFCRRSSLEGTTLAFTCFEGPQHVEAAQVRSLDGQSNAQLSVSLALSSGI